MARYLVDHDGLRVGVVLTSEHRDVDLTTRRSDGSTLGDALLDEVVAGMLTAHERAESPEGHPWQQLAASTVRQKGHSLIGIHTGKSGITDPVVYIRGDRVIKAREAWWLFPHQRTPSGVDLHDICHGWQNGVPRNNMPPRRLIGWTRDAQREADRILREADFHARE
jgi:hypothetical protein